MIIIKNISLQSDDSGKLYQKLKKILKRDNFNWEIYRKSIDARKGISYNFQVLVDVEISDRELGKIKGAERYSEENFEIQVKNPPKKVAIVGSGPAGLFCAYILSSYGVKVNVYEQGEPVEDRIKAIEKYLETGELNVNSNIQFGEGGAGTFSDGKLTARSKDKRVREVLKIFREHGAPKEIMYDSKPHIGTDILQNVIISMREKIKENGGEYHFSHKFQDMEVGENINSIIINNSKVFADRYVLALGNSSREAFEFLSKKIEMENKPFAVGFRIEHKRADIDFAQYKVKRELPSASYQLSYNDKEIGKSAYTFCMCPGGYVVDSSSELGKTCVNGMSYHSRDGENSNSALIVTIDKNTFGEDVLAGMNFQREIESKTYELGKGNIPVQRLGDFIENRVTEEFGAITPSTAKYVKANLRGIYSGEIEEMIINATKYMGKRLKGFDTEDAILSAAETRSSSPVRMLRDENLKSIGFDNLYVIGEGSGYSGGIVSSAIDGIKAAENILGGN